jgi:peptide/nickel transport system ATP-binding protein
MTLLVVDNLSLVRAGTKTRILSDASIALGPGETLGIAGESGCGKSSFLLALMGIVKPGLGVGGGTVTLSETDMFRAPPDQLRGVRGKIVAMVPQNATLALTPTMRIGAQVAEAIAVHEQLSKDQIEARVLRLLERVRLPDPARIGNRYPHELSGGQMQRVAIAMALACEPRLLLLDEPTTGLDVMTQAGILDLLDTLRRETGIAIVCVSHDIGVLARLTSRIVVMYAGRIIENRATRAFLDDPAHPYARALLASVPRIGAGTIPPSIPGRPPAPGTTGAACAFSPRCAFAAPVCAAAPLLRERPVGGQVACHLSGPWPASVAAPVAPRHTVDTRTEPVLNVRDLRVDYSRKGLFGFGGRSAPVVDGISLDLAKGEILGLVGESGSGKSSILRAIAGLWPRSAGTIRMTGQDLAPLATDRDRTSLRRIQVVFQNPDASLNPRQSVREILAHPLRLYFGLGPADVESRVRSLLTDVRLDPSYLDRRPTALSGGERQRVALARAFAADPDIILCDEVTSALDMSVQASVLALIRDLSLARGTACLFVAHDLGVVASLCDRVAVLNGGRIVEEGTAAQVCTAPRDPYTTSLVQAVLSSHLDEMPTKTPAALA